MRASSDNSPHPYPSPKKMGEGGGIENMKNEQIETNAASVLMAISEAFNLPSPVVGRRAGDEGQWSSPKRKTITQLDLE